VKKRKQRAEKKRGKRRLVYWSAEYLRLADFDGKSNAKAPKRPRLSKSAAACYEST
jgi:hypothetical protein